MKLTVMHAYRVAIFLVILAGIAVAFPGFYESFFKTKTDFAFVKMNIISIRPNGSGIVRKSYVTLGQSVKKGDLLVDLDESDFNRILAEKSSALSEKQSELAELERERERIPFQLNSEKLSLDIQRERVDLLEKNTARITALQQRGFATDRALDEIRGDLAEAKLVMMRSLQAIENLREDEAGIQRQISSLRENVKNVELELALAQAAKVYTQIRAPVDGQIVRFDIVDQQLLSQNVPYIQIAASEPYWIEARFRERDFTNLSVGLPVDVKLDAYPDEVLKGEITSISTASAAEFAALPTRRGSGSFTKVAQWIPVRISLRRAERLKTLKLASGMSAEVTLGSGR
jgi:multidrug resistance efflux pump